ncbi:MAG: RNA polymerase sigma factor [Planctomycetota bacterium]
MGRNRDDLELVERCISGEPGAWRQFVDRFAPTVRALARRYLRLHGQIPDSAELDDVAQDVFLAVTRREFRLLKNYDPTYTFKTYLGVITRTEVHRILRKKRPLLGGPAELERAAPAEADASAEAERAEEREVLTAAMDTLPDRDAEILKLRFLREMDYKTIAATLRIPEASVGQTLFRAKQRLLDKLRAILGILV